MCRTAGRVSMRAVLERSWHVAWHCEMFSVYVKAHRFCGGAHATPLWANIGFPRRCYIRDYTAKTLFTVAPARTPFRLSLPKLASLWSLTNFRVSLFSRPAGVFVRFQGVSRLSTTQLLSRFSKIRVFRSSATTPRPGPVDTSDWPRIQSTRRCC